MAYALPYSSLPSADDFDDDWPNANVKTKSVYFPTNVVDTSRLDPLTMALLKPNKLYVEYCAQWADWYNWFSGKMIKQYIHRHIRERKDAYKRRQARSYYWNYTEEIVKLYGSFLYSKNIGRTFFKDSQDLAEQEMLEKNEFWANVDLKGTHIDAYMKKIFTLTQVFNFVDVLVDMPRTPTQLYSEQERLDEGIRPYIYHILPFNAVNWERDSEGNLLWYRYRECVERQENPYIVNSDDETWRYTTWTRFDWQVHEVVFRQGEPPQARLVDGDIHPLGEVPVVRFYGDADLIEEDCGNSFVSKIGPVNVAVMNYCVTGDTLIDLPRNLKNYPHGVPIKKLVGETFDTYSWSRKERCFVLSRATAVRKTGVNREVWRLTYRYKGLYNEWCYGELRATPDHKILLQDGTYHQLQYLKKGDKLIPFNRWVNAVENGYAVIYPDTTKDSAMLEHRFVMAAREELLSGYHVHHKDENRVNNKISNLVQLTRADHMSHHMYAFWSRLSIEERTAIATRTSENSKAYWNSKTPQEQKAWGNFLGKIAKAWWAEMDEATKTAYLTRRGATRSKNLKAQGKWSGEDNPMYASARFGSLNPMFGRDRSNELNPMFGKKHSDETKLKMSENRRKAREKRKSEVMNHEVISVEFYGYEDVYCMSVEKTHNFVANGIVVHNCSLIEEDIYSKVLNLLVIENPNSASDELDPNEQGTTQRGGLELGTNNALEWSGTTPPFYLAPAADPGQFILSLIEKCIDEMYKLSTLWTDTGIRESRSGVSYSYEFNRTNQMLADKAKVMEEGEEKVHKLYAKWLGEQWLGEISYPESFDVETLQQELDEILSIKKAVRSPTLIREVEKRVSRKILTHATTQVMQEVITEIDTLPSLEEQAAERMAEQQEQQAETDVSDSDNEG